MVLGHINNQLHKNSCIHFVHFVPLIQTDLAFYNIYIYKNVTMVMFDVRF